MIPFFKNFIDGIRRDQTVMGYILFPIIFFTLLILLTTLLQQTEAIALVAKKLEAPDETLKPIIALLNARFDGDISITIGELTKKVELLKEEIPPEFSLERGDPKEG